LNPSILEPSIFEPLFPQASAIRFHIESFGEDVLEVDPSIIEAFIAEAGV